MARYYVAHSVVEDVSLAENSVLGNLENNDHHWVSREEGLGVAGRVGAADGRVDAPADIASLKPPLPQ